MQPTKCSNAGDTTFNLKDALVVASETLVTRDFARIDGASDKDVFHGIVQDVVKVRFSAYVGGFLVFSLYYT